MAPLVPVANWAIRLLGRKCVIKISVSVSARAEWSEKSAKCMLYCALANNNNNHNEVVVETILNK